MQPPVMIRRSSWTFHCSHHVADFIRAFGLQKDEIPTNDAEHSSDDE
jgi:hypothetical protein